ncbi:efflux transporter outer membrane subunit [Parerythrobacter aurantius]|uniref:efflux transporter outer membrane subunit n=1 Tax=Parerythrobacter aurantius TaxID=3127706 RepID=UPI00324A3F3A
MMRTVLPLAAALALGACVAGPPPVIDTAPPVLPLQFAFAPDQGIQASVANLLPSGDPAYRSLAALALAEAPTLAQAAARIEQARAQAAGAGANRLPSLGADAAVTGSRINPAQFGGALPGGISIDTEQVSYGANLRASWDPDLFGRLRAQERAAIARIDAADAEAGAVRNALLAEIAGAVIDSRTLDARLAALQQDLAAAEDLARLAGSRERAGIAPGFDRVRAESTAEASRTRIAALASDRARLVGRLVTLTGQSAQDVRAALLQPAPALAQPQAPATLPSALLANRPDVLAAEAQLRAADADLAATAARRFPQFTLSAALGLLAFDLADLFDENSVVGSVGGSLLAPLLDFGRIEAEIDASAAGKRLAFAGYRNAIFTALGDAEAGYGLVAAADNQLAAATREYAAASRAAKIADTRYRAGLSDFLTVLEARRAADASGERVAIARGQAERARVILWQALGGDGQPTSRSTSQ